MCCHHRAKCAYLSAGIDIRTLCDGKTAGEWVAVRVLSFELSADTASVDLEAPGSNEECKGGLVPWWMESQ